MLKFKKSGCGYTKWIDTGKQVFGYIISTDLYDKGECYDLMCSWLAKNEKELFEKFNINPRDVKDFLLRR